MIAIVICKCWLLLTLAAVPPPQMALDNGAISNGPGVLVTYAPPLR